MSLFRAGLPRHLLILTCITIIPVLAVFWHMGAAQRKQAIQFTEQQIFQNIQLFNERQAGLIAETRHVLSVIANLPELSDEMSQECDEALANIHVSSPQYSTIVLANNSGYINCCAVPLEKAIDISDREWFQRAHKTKDFVVGNYIKSRTSGIASLPLAYPVLGENHEVKFIVGAALNLQKYDAVFEGLSLPEGSLIHITDKNGAVLYCSDKKHGYTGDSLSENLGFPMPSGLEGKVATAGDDTETMHWYKRLTVGHDHNNIYIFISVPRKVVLGSADNLFMIHLFTFAFLLAIAFLLSWQYGKRSIIKPVNDLIIKTKKVSAGRYSEAVGESSLQGDFRNLELAFNEMVTKIIKRGTERDLAEQALKKNQEKLSAYVSSDIIGVWWVQLDPPISIHDPVNLQVEKIFDHSVISYSNDLYARMYGYENGEDVIGKKIIDLAKGDAGQAKRLLRRFIKSGYMTSNHEFEIELLSGNHAWFLMSASAVIENGRIALIMGSQLDVTEFKRHENLNKALLNLVDDAGQSDGQKTLQKFLDEAERLTNSKIGFFHFVKNDQKNIELQTWSSNTLATMCQVEDFDKHYPINKAGIWADCVKTKAPTIHNDYQSLTQKNGLPEGHAPLKRELVVPVLRSNKVVAILGVGNKPAPYDDTDLTLLQTLSDTAWETVLRVRTEQQLQQTLDGLEIQVKERTHKLNEMFLELEAIFETSRVGMVVLDDKRRIRKANRRFAEIFGHDTPDEIEGRSSAEFHLSIEQFDAFGKKYYRKIGQGKVLQTELQMKKKDGTTIWCSLSGKALNLENPKDLSKGILWVVDDITERIQIEEDRRALAKKLQAAHQLGRSGWWEYDIDTDTVHWPEETYALYGLLPDIDLDYDKLLDVIDPDFRDYHDQQLELMLKSGKGNFTYPITRPDGKNRWIWARGEVEYNEKGYPKKLFGTLQDITEQKRAEEALQASENRFRSLFERNSSIMLLLNPENGSIVEANQAASDFYGWTIEELKQKTIHDINQMPPEEVKALMAETKGREAGHFYFRHKRKDDSTKDVEVFSSELVIGEQEILCSIIHDVTARKQAEAALVSAREEAETANRAKSTFLSNMSHELRTPLNAILGYTQIFSTDETLTEQQQSGINTIHLAGEHLLMIINDILDMSKIESGKIELVTSEVVLEPFLMNITDFFSYQARQKGIDFHFESDEDLPEVVMLDELRLRQVVFNLLSNAIKFTTKGYCRFTAEVEQLPENDILLTFTVEDSGIGIGKKDQKAIFEPFKQIGDRLKHSEGSGLGLAISRQLIRLMGGEIEVESPIDRTPQEGIGRGSRFFFTIKVKSVSSASYHVQDPYEFVVGYSFETNRKERIRALVVDDKRSNRAVIRDTLRPLGFDVLEAEDGNRVAALCMQFQTDIILMDLRMPGCDGFAALSQVKSHKELEEIPVIAITASTAEKQTLKKRCLDHGFSSFIDKPISVSFLLEEMARLLPITLLYKKKPSLERTLDDKLVLDEQPPPEALSALSKLIGQGDIDGIIQQINALETAENGRYKAF